MNQNLRIAVCVVVLMSLTTYVFGKVTAIATAPKL